jgi:L-asparagine transporter-like permease
MVLSAAGLPFAAGIMNFVVLTAALSSANANIYLMTRTLFSLARAGFVPPSLGFLSPNGAPLRALLTSSVGLACAIVVRTFWPDSAYVWFFGVALFGALFVWLMIFVTHLAFRRWWKRRQERPPVVVPLARASSTAGAVLIVAVLLTTWWAPGLRITLLAGVPWLVLLWLGYLTSRPRAGAGAESNRHVSTTVTP